MWGILLQPNTYKLATYQNKYVQLQWDSPFCVPFAGDFLLSALLSAIILSLILDSLHNGVETQEAMEIRG